jgi:hypothetical protein
MALTLGFAFIAIPAALAFPLMQRRPSEDTDPFVL